MEFIIVYVTYPNMEEAEKIVSHLIEKKLISCANLLTAKSYYSWKGKIENSNEIVSICKTRKENWEKVRDEIGKIHSYEIPCIIKIDAKANDEFEKWVGEETAKN